MNFLNQLTKTLDQYYVKLPALPKGGKDFIVSIAAWAALIFGILAIISGINMYRGLSTVSYFAAIAGVSGYATTVTISIIFLIIQGVIELLAFSPLKANKTKGWNLIFYSLIVGMIGSVVTLVVTLNVASIIGPLVGVLIGYYILYQVKPYYK